MPESDAVRIVAKNRKAFHDFHVVEEYEAGMVLRGTEVKSIRGGRVSFKDSFADINKGEVFLKQLHISPYPHAHNHNHDPLRPRKLLLHNREIKKLIGKTRQKGYTLVPTRIYFKNGLVKVKLALAKGKKLYDKRESIKQRDVKRDLDRQKKEYKF